MTINRLLSKLIHQIEVKLYSPPVSVSLPGTRGLEYFWSPVHTQ